LYLDASEALREPFAAAHVYGRQLARKLDVGFSPDLSNATKLLRVRRWPASAGFGSIDETVGETLSIPE
jgi:hypothetical protein